MYHARIVLVTC